MISKALCYQCYVWRLSPAYLTGYPICHIVGYNVEPSNCNWVNFADSGLTLPECSAACQEYTGFDCLSYSWGYKNGGCVLYSGRVEDCQNYAEGVSKYAVYDIVCPTSWGLGEKGILLILAILSEHHETVFGVHSANLTSFHELPALRFSLSYIQLFDIWEREEEKEFQFTPVLISAIAARWYSIV